nr:protein FAR1-related sequence 5 [Tanacetum cinerariifolium]
LDALCTPKSFVTHSNFDTPDRTVYYILKVSADVLLVKRNVHDSVDDCVVAYMKYAAEAGFVVRRSCQKRLRNGDVKQKYLVCNRKGCPKGIHVDTLDLENSEKQKRNSNLHITGCKARAVFNLDPRTRKFVLNVFDTIHNHKLEREEFKHLSKRKRQLTYLEQAFIVKTAIVNIAIDNHRKCVTVAAGLLKNENTKSYIWLLKAFIKAFGKAPSIVVIDQDGAMRNAIEAEFAGSKHRLCMWHITQKLFAKKKKKKKSQSVDKCKDLGKCKDKAEEDDPVDLFFKKDRLYKVLQNIGDGLVVCSCQLFVRVGILCKNIFCVFKNASVEMIPQQYILRHWTKNLILAALRNKRNRYGKKNVDVENFANEATLIVDYCVHLLSKDEPRLGALVEKLKSLKKDDEADCPNPPSKNKTDNLEQLVRVPKPPVVKVNNPTIEDDVDNFKRCCTSYTFDVGDFIFETKDGAATIRDYMQTLAPQLKVESNAIDTFSLILNHEQKMNRNEDKIKYFFHTTMIKKDMFKWKKENGENDEEKQFEAFSKTIKSEFIKDPEMKNMKDLEMGNTVIIDNSKTKMTYDSKYKTVCELLLLILSNEKGYMVCRRTPLGLLRSWQLPSRQ